MVCETENMASEDQSTRLWQHDQAALVLDEQNLGAGMRHQYLLNDVSKNPLLGSLSPI